jgi:hypothetical protein
MKLNENEPTEEASLKLTKAVKTGGLCGNRDQFDGNLIIGRTAVGVEAAGA